MKVLVTFYSRTGLTKKVAAYISEKLEGHTDEIVDIKNRSGAIGYVVAGKDATQKKFTQIRSTANLKDYDLIIIGGPVWAWTMSPAIRTYLTENKDILKTKKIAFFATQGSDGADKKFKAMQEILESKPLNTMTINSRDFREDAYKKKVDDFIRAF
jgi:menaquinone-dependent protoporphyrinogen IX oxidase